MPNPYSALIMAGGDPDDESGFAPRAFKGKQDPNWFVGFGASALSSIPEAFGAQPWETAEAFRATSPVGGFVSEMAGWAPLLLAPELAVARAPALAARLEGATGKLVGKFGMDAAKSPIARGIARESIINAPLELTRLGTGAAFFPENEEQFGNVMTDVALTAGLGGAFGALAKGGTRRAARPIIEGTSDIEHPVFQLRAIDEGAEVLNADREQLANELEREIFTGHPGYAGAKQDKPIDYVLPLAGHTPEQTKGMNSLFVPSSEKMFKEGSEALTEDPHNPLVGFSKQYFVENGNANGPAQNLVPGERDALLALLPEGLQTSRDVAKNLVSPRIVKVHDEKGARELAGLLNLPGMIKVGKTSLVQEKDGLFVLGHKLIDGPPQPIKSKGRRKKGTDAVGEGAGQVRPGDVYLMGKTDNPGLFEPEAAKMSELVTANWAKNIPPFQVGRNNNMFNQLYDDLVTALPPKDWGDAQKIKNHKKRKEFIADKLGASKAREKGLLDQKYNFSSSRQIQEVSDWLSRQLKPTIFLRRDNPNYNRLYTFMEAGQHFAKRMKNDIVFGKPVIEGTSEQAIRGKNVRYESGYKGHLPFDQMRGKAVDADANLLMHMAAGDVATPANLKALVKDGALSADGLQLAERMRGVNQDMLGDIVPVLDEAGHAQTVWLENHMGLPKQYQGDHFVKVVDKATGEVKHTAFGKSGSAAEFNAKVAIDEAAAEGEEWIVDEVGLRSLKGSTEDELKELQAAISKNLARNPTDVKIMTRAMRRLATIKATTGKNPGIPVTTPKLKERVKDPTAPDTQIYTMDDLANAYAAHVDSMMKFAGISSWNSRFGDVLPEMLKHDPKLAADLVTKSREHLGLPSKTTNVMDEKLADVIGTSFGSRPASQISAAVNEGMFAFTLGIMNPAHAVLSLLSPLQTVAPHIMHMATIPIEAAADLMQFTPVMGHDGRPRGMSAWLEPIKVLSQAIVDCGNPDAALKAGHVQGIRDGVFGSQVIEEFSGGTSKARTSLNEAWQKGGFPAFIRKVSTVMADKSESLSRLVAFNASWRIGRDFFGLTGDELYNFARKSNQMTMYNYHTVDRSNLFTGPVGSMFGLFKTWQMHFMGSMMRYAGLAINEGNFGPLVWSGASAVALGGMGATPLIAMADGLGNWENESNSSYLWMQKRFGPGLADPLYFGLPAFLGVSLQASSTLPGTDVRNEVNSLFSFAIAQRATMLGKAIGKGWEYNEATGNNPLNDSNVRDMLMQATAPRAMIRAMSVVEGDYVKSMSTGYPMLQGENVGYVGKMLQGIGMNSLEIAKAQEASQVLYRHEEQMKSAVSGLGRGYYNALQDKNYEEAERIIQRTIAMRVPLDSVMKSSMAIRQREEGSDILSRYSNVGQYEARRAMEMQYPGQ